MRIHSNATTTPKQRRFFKESSKSCRSLATIYAVSPSTIAKWKGRENVTDKTCRPNIIHYTLEGEEEKLILHLRSYGLSLDAVVDAVEPMLPHAKRVTVHRTFVRNGVNQRQKPDKEEHGKFKEYPPGYLHIDCFYLPKMEGKKRYCYVAIDRATRLVFLYVYERRDKHAAVDFLGRCLSFFPFFIRTILTDNGREFTLRTFRNKYGNKTKEPHPFGEVCSALKIDHRLTRIYTPKTNGLVERANGQIQADTVKRQKYQDAQEMILALHLWMLQFNFLRKNRVIGRKTPYQKALDWYQQQPELFIKEPAHLLHFCSQ